jgi:hypothetical protein
MAGEVWAPPTDASLTVGSVGLSADMLAIRDLAAALAARATGAPWLNAIGAQVVFFVGGNWNVPADVYRAQVTVIGAGGAGGAGIDNNGGAAAAGAGGGGGAGAWSVVGGLTVVPAAVVVVTIGAAGAGGAGVGGNGGNSSIAHPATWTVTANGGTGGAAGTAAGAAGGAGGTTLLGTDAPGARGGDGVVLGTTLGFSGHGAAGFLGGGAAAQTADAVGRNANVPGTGGSGGFAVNAGGMQTRNGGDGAAGAVIIEY